MYALYITHPQVRIDPTVPVRDWKLSDIGAERARRAFSRPFAQEIRRIVSSTEIKAQETALLLSKASGVEVEHVHGMHENEREATGYLPPEEFERAADWFFAHPHASYKGWERAIDAQARIVGAVEAILAAHDPAAPIAFIGHGAVGTLLKCHLSHDVISRRTDQPAGGGNLFCFDLADRKVTCDWTPIENWTGVRS